MKILSLDSLHIFMHNIFDNITFLLQIDTLK